jgi:hypothetical protein
MSAHFQNTDAGVASRAGEPNKASAEAAADLNTIPTPESAPPTTPRDAPYWAEAAQRIHAPRRDAPRGVVPGNINNRRPVGPLQGFGRLWQKTY